MVIPAFNAARYLPATLTSLQGQTIKDWEAVVVDDGSTDDTAAVATRFSADDPRIQYIQQSNRGASDARNSGLAHVRTEWLLFLDADDWLLPEFLEKMFAKLDEEPSADVVCCPYHRVTVEGELLPVEWWPDVIERTFETFANECALCIHCVIVRSRLVSEVGGFDVGLTTCEDWDLWQRIARMGSRFVAVMEPLGRYRIRSDSLSHDSQKVFTDALVVMGRAWRADPRVPNPDPRFADGIRGTDAHANGIVACWLAGIEAGEGRDGLDVLDKLTDLMDYQDDLEAVVEAVLQGFKVGAQLRPEKLPAAWPRFEPAARRIFARLCAASTRPELLQQMMMTLESKVLKNGDLSEVVRLSTMAGVRVDVRKFEAINPPPGVDSMHLELRAGAQVLGHVVVPIWGGMNGRDVADFTVRQSGLKRILRGGGYVRRPYFWLQLARQMMGASPEIWRTLRDKSVSRKRRLKSTMRDALGHAVIAMVSRRINLTAGPDDATVAKAIIEEERARAAREHPAPAAKQVASSAAINEEEKDKKRYWEQVFSKADPWNYGSAYEQLKYERTLTLLGSEPVGTALEIACAEGRFTVQLAPRVGALRAVDISATAVERARERCRQHTNIEFGELDLMADDVPGPVDLIICSEVLYFVSAEELVEVAEKYRDALNPRGRIVMAHASCIGDDPKRTGFDWGHDFGARTIRDTFASTPGLALESSIVTELYRIDLFRRVAEGESLPAATTEQLGLDTALDLDVEKYIIWGGAIARRSDVAREVADVLPILAYHRIADSGPELLAPYRVSPQDFEAQLNLLRRYGCHAITMRDLWSHMRYGAPFTGRPVLITFDDGYVDFATHAWPILQRRDFSAEVFVVTDKIGSAADWDVEYGVPAPLMDWATIESLSRQGVGFGSHLSSHKPADSLGSDELLREAARSRAVLERRLGTEVLSVATPFGLIDSRIVRVYELCGYKLAFSTDPRRADVRHNPLAIPRIEVQGGWDLDQFARAVGLLPPAPDQAQGQDAG